MAVLKLLLAGIVLLSSSLLVSGKADRSEDTQLATLWPLPYENENFLHYLWRLYNLWQVWRGEKSFGEIMQIFLEMLGQETAGVWVGYVFEVISWYTIGGPVGVLVRGALRPFFGEAASFVMKIVVCWTRIQSPLRLKKDSTVVQS